MALTAVELQQHRARMVSDDELEEHKWEVALHDERAMLEGRAGTDQEKPSDVSSIEQISDQLGDRKKAKPRTATRGDDAETRSE
jgi:hypothetical protein